MIKQMNYFKVLLLLLVFFFSVNNNSAVLAENVFYKGDNVSLDQIAQTNIPPWFYEEAKKALVSANASSQQDNQELGRNIFRIIPEEEMINWAYTLADLDHSGKIEYLVIVYGEYAGYRTVVILKEMNGQYIQVWAPPLGEYIIGHSSVDVHMDDLTGDGMPAIIITMGEGATEESSGAYIIVWKGTASYLLAPSISESYEIQLPAWVNLEVFDVNADGKKELLQRFYNEQKTTSPESTELEREYYYEIYKFDNEQPVYDRTIYDKDAQLLGSTIQIVPSAWSLSWANSSQSERIKATISDIEDSHPVSEINPASVRLEDRVLPTRTYIENSKFIAEFDKQEVMIYLRKAPRLKPLALGDKIDITISALLPSGQYVSGSSEIEIVEELKSIPFSQFDIKHWRISWDPGKHNRNKFHLAGKIDLPDDYALDMLQKKGAVTITIEKKNSLLFSQNATLYFKQNGPIWRYKASKAQNGIQQPLDIEKMLIFWQPEVSQDKPGKAGKGHRKRTGWFMIQGNINISDADQAVLLPKASLTLNIPVENTTTAGSIESTDNINFTTKKGLWSFQSPPPNPEYKDNWWENIKDED